MKDDKRMGLVAGYLTGDALGAPFHAVKAGHIQQLAGGRIDGYLANPILFPEKPARNHLPGLHAVTGQEFLAVLAGAADDGTGRSPLARAAAHLLDLAGEDDMGGGNAGVLRAPGKPLRRALERWRTEYLWELADYLARDTDGEGASPCARALACSLTEGATPLDATRLTHVRETSLVAAVVVARAGELLLADDDPKKTDAGAILEDLIETARAAEDELREGVQGEIWRDLGWGNPVCRFSECLSPLASLLKTGDDTLAEKTLVRQAVEFAPQRPVSHLQHGFAPVLVPWVLYRALGPLGPSHAVEDAINRGGEAPLAAGLIGGLTGARHGFDRLPDDWIEGCLAMEWAGALARNPSTAAVQGWIEAERSWTGREHALRRPLQEEIDRNRHDRLPAKKTKKEPAIIEDSQSLPFAPPPQVWLEQKGDELAPWEKKRLKSERARKRIDWKEDRRRAAKNKRGGEDSE